MPHRRTPCTMIDDDDRRWCDVVNVLSKLVFIGSVSVYVSLPCYCLRCRPRCLVFGPHTPGSYILGSCATTDDCVHPIAWKYGTKSCWSFDLLHLTNDDDHFQINYLTSFLRSFVHVMTRSGLLAWTTFWCAFTPIAPVGQCAWLLGHGNLFL